MCVYISPPSFRLLVFDAFLLLDLRRVGGLVNFEGSAGVPFALKRIGAGCKRRNQNVEIKTSKLKR